MKQTETFCYFCTWNKKMKKRKRKKPFFERASAEGASPALSLSLVHFAATLAHAPSLALKARARLPLALGRKRLVFDKAVPFTLSRFRICFFFRPPPPAGWSRRR